jgi:hypothetical protein
MAAQHHDSHDDRCDHTEYDEQEQDCRYALKSHRMRLRIEDNVLQRESRRSLKC